MADEGPIKKWIKDAIYAVMDDAVANACLVNASGLWIGNGERIVAAVAVTTCSKVVME